MKKSYVKPQVYFENFQLSANIAGNCGTQIDKTRAHHTNVDSCAYEDAAFGKIFLSKQICGDTPQDEILSNVCYDNPSDTMRLFAS